MDKSKQTHHTTAAKVPQDYPPTDGSRATARAHSETPNVDHHARIGELAVELRNASPSGANTISDKILFHLEAIADPKAYDAKVAADKKAEDEREAIRKAERDKLKTPDADKAKVA